MTYLVDANVLSEPTKTRPDSKVVAWLTAHEGDFVIDAIVLGELSFGILGLSTGRKRVQLEEWFNAVVSAIECLPWDAAVSLRWARLVVGLKKKGIAGMARIYRVVSIGSNIYQQLRSKKSSAR